MADHRKCLHPAPTCSLSDFQIAPRGGFVASCSASLLAGAQKGAQRHLPIGEGGERIPEGGGLLY